MPAPLLSSHIDSVTVYRAGALVERVVALPKLLPEGGGVRVGGLPLSLADSTVRARVEGSRRLQVRDLRVTLTHERVEGSLRPVEPEALRAARRRRAQLDERRAHLEAQRERLVEVSAGTRGKGKPGEPPPPSPFAARLAWLDLRGELVESLDDELERAREALKQAEEELAALEAREREATSERAPLEHELRKAAQLTLAGVVTPEARLVIEYQVPGARWVPSYSVTLDRALARGRLAMRAVVSQRTGEDWTGVALALSTADPQRWNELPELKSVRIGRRQPPSSARGWRPPPVGAGELFADYQQFRSKHLAPPKPSKPKPPPPRPSPPPPPLNMAAPVGAAMPGGPTGAPMPSAAPQSMTRAGGLPPGVTMQDMIRRAEAEARAKAELQALEMERHMAPAGQIVMQKKSSGLGALFGGGGGPPPAQASRRSRAVTPSAPPPRRPPPAPAVSARPEDAWLDFGELRMPAADEARRGKLVRLEVHERYRELVWVRERSYERHVVSLIEGATARARGVGGRPLPPRHKPITQAELAGFDYLYPAEGRVDIVSDGEFHSVPLFERDMSVKPYHVVVPRESNDVFRRVKIRNPLEMPLLSGPADVYLGGDFLLSTGLRACAPRGEFEVGLGVVQAVKVARNTRFAEESAGLMGGSLLLRHAIDIEIANRLEHEVAIEVRERVPVTRDGDDEVVVEVAEAKPPWRHYEPEEHKLRGGYKWKVRVPAGETLSLHARYVIRISSRRELVGGNRRER